MHAHTHTAQVCGIERVRNEVHSNFLWNALMQMRSTLSSHLPYDKPIEKLIKWNEKSNEILENNKVENTVSRSRVELRTFWCDCKAVDFVVFKCSKIVIKCNEYSEHFPFNFKNYKENIQSSAKCYCIWKRGEHLPTGLPSTHLSLYSHKNNNREKMRKCNEICDNFSVSTFFVVKK